MAVCLDVDSDATRRDDRRDDSTDGTKKVACSQSQCPVTLNRDTIVPGFVILANPLTSCALTRLSTSRPGEAATCFFVGGCVYGCQYALTPLRSLSCPSLHHRPPSPSPPSMATRPVVISHLALPGRHPSQKFVQHPSRRHARVLPETIGTAVTLNVVKCLERARPLITATLCLPPPTAESNQHRRLGVPAAPIEHHESTINPG
jgi:hypothetical protein